MENIKFLNYLYKNMDGIFNHHFLDFSIKYFNDNNIKSLDNYNYKNLEQEIKKEYLKKIKSVDIYNPYKKEYLENFDAIFSGKIPIYILDEYIEEILKSINQTSNGLFFTIFNNNYKNTLNSFINLIRHQKNIMLKNEYFSNKSLLNFGFNEKFLEKIYQYKKGLIIKENNDYFMGVFELFVPELNNIISNLNIVNRFDLKHKGNIGELAVFNTLDKYFNNKKVNIHKNVYYVDNNKEYEIDFIIEYYNLLIVGSIKNNKISKKTNKKLFINPMKQTKKFHESLLKNKKISIYNNSNNSKNKNSNKIKEIELKNKDIIHLGISIEHISDFINLYESPEKIKHKNIEFNIKQIIISYSDLIVLLNMYEHYFEIFHYFYIRSNFSKNKDLPQFKEKSDMQIGFLDDELQHFYLYNKFNDYFSYINNQKEKIIVFQDLEQEICNYLAYNKKYEKYNFLTKIKNYYYLYHFLTSDIEWNLIKEIYNCNEESLVMIFDLLYRIKNNKGEKQTILKGIVNLKTYNLVFLNYYTEINKKDLNSIINNAKSMITLFIFYENDEFKIKKFNRKELKKFLKQL